MNKHTHLIFAMDDDIDDLDLLRDAINALDSTATFLTAPNGAEGIERLHSLKARGEQPCVIVLDINMPVMDGRQTYTALKADTALQDIPVVVFSTSNSALDKTFFEAKGADYFTKPGQFHQLLEVARQFLLYCRP